MVKDNVSSNGEEAEGSEDVFFYNKVENVMARAENKSWDIKSCKCYKNTHANHKEEMKFKVHVNNGGEIENWVNVGNSMRGRERCVWEA